MLNVGKLILTEVQLISQWNEMKYSHSDVCNPMDCRPQAPLSMEFPRQEYWSGWPFLSPGDLPNPGTEPRSPALQADFSYFKLTYVGSSNVWYGGGHLFSHSKFVAIRSTVRTSCLDVNASQIIKIISITAVKEINEPTDEMVFHIVYASG